MYHELFGLQESVFRTIASRKRLEIIQLLGEKELTVSEITRMLGMRQSNVSQHLHELRSAGIVTTRKEATTIYYQLADARIARACQEIRSFIEATHPLSDTMQHMLHDKNGIFPVAVDPVCGMRLSESYARCLCTQNGVTHYFCGEGCKDEFLRNVTAS